MTTGLRFLVSRLHCPSDRRDFDRNGSVSEISGGIGGSLPGQSGRSMVRTRRETASAVQDGKENA
jgi:hypothetical protein